MRYEFFVKLSKNQPLCEEYPSSFYSSSARLFFQEKRFKCKQNISGLLV
jgi:hypothetical protein